MSKTEIVYARLELQGHDKHLRLIDRKHEINERLHEVLNDEFYLKNLTQALADVHSDIFDVWARYQKHDGSLSLHEVPQISAVGKFEVQDQKVTLLDVRFY